MLATYFRQNAGKRRSCTTNTVPEGAFDVSAVFHVIFDEAFVKEGQTESYSYSWKQDINADEATYSEDYAPSNVIPGTDQKMGEFYAFFFDPAENDEVDEDGNPVARCDENKGLALSTAMKYLHDMTSNAANSLALSLDLKAYIAKHEIQPETSTPAELAAAETTPFTQGNFTYNQGEQRFANLPNGYYLVEETTKSGSISASILETVGPNVTIALKTVTPTVTKTVSKVNDNAQWDGGDTFGDKFVPSGKEGISVEVGDKVTFRVDMAVPDVKGKNERDFYWYQLVDEGDENGVLEMEDESGYEFYLKHNNKDSNNNYCGTDQKLVENEDYVRVPKTREEVNAILADSNNEKYDESYRKIVAQLVMYVFTETKAGDIAALEGDEKLYAPATAAFNAAMDNAGNFTDKDGNKYTDADKLYEDFSGGKGGIVFRLTTSDKFHANDTIIVEIDAIVSEKATNEKIENRVKLRYTRDPQALKPSPGNVEETPDETPVYTHNITVTKVDSSNNTKILTGAVFEIYKPGYDAEELAQIKADYGESSDEYQTALRATAEEPLRFIEQDGQYTLLSGKKAEAYDAYEKSLAEDYDGEEVEKPENYDTIKANLTTSVKVDDNGNVKLNGLNKGTYLIRETVAPAGYNVPESAFPFTITPTYNSNDGSLENLAASAITGTDTATDGQMTISTATGTPTPGDTAIPNTIFAKLSNEKGGKLPSTGGNGTMMFTIIGGTFGVIMLALLVNELKKKEN